MTTDTRRRVKLYALNAERQWDDRGTGHVSSNYVDRLKGISLLVRAESDGSLLLESKIQPDTAYQKQQDTLIVWSEGDNFDLALSFQEKAGCDEIWEKICQVQGKDPSVEITQDIVEESEDERFEEMSDTAPPIELPPCELARLEDISETIQSCITTPLRKEKLAMALESENYIKKLLNLFHVCEDLENTEGLHHLFEIFKNIFLLNKNALFEIMFADDTIFDVVGCLEYDPSVSQPKKHRQYLKQWAKFREAVPIKNQDLLAKIHQTFRVQYIQDIILPAPSVFCEDNMLNTLSSFIFFNKVEIVTLIQEDERFLLDVFTLLTDPNTPDAKRRDIVLFLKEFCNYAQNLQPQGKDSFYKTLTCLGILQALEITLVMNDQKTKSASIDILTAIVEFSPLVVRNYTLQQVSRSEGVSQIKDKMLLNIAIEQMLTDSEPELGVAVQLMGIIKTLLEPENMLTEKADFLNFFYKHSIQTLIAPLLLNTVGDRPQNEDYQTAQLLGIVLDILSFCVEHHTYHIKNFIIQKDLLKRILVLMKSSHTFLVLGALRLLRKIVALKDDFYNRHIVKSNLFAPVVDAFIRNNGRYNLLESAILELFEFIKLEDIRTLCLYFVENFSKIFDDIEYVQTFKYLKNRYDQAQDRVKERDRNSMDNQLPIIRNNPSRFRRDQRQMEEEEEMWFNEDDDFADELDTYNSVMKPVTEKTSLQMAQQQKSPPQNPTQHTSSSLHSSSNGSSSNCNVTTTNTSTTAASISPTGVGDGGGNESPTHSSNGDSNDSLTNNCEQHEAQNEVVVNTATNSHLEVAAAAAAAALQQHQQHTLQTYQQQHIKNLSRTLAAAAVAVAAAGVTSTANPALSCSALSESSSSSSSNSSQNHQQQHDNQDETQNQPTNIDELQQQLAAVEKQHNDENASHCANQQTSVATSIAESAAVAVAATASQLLTIATAMAASCGSSIVGSAVTNSVLGGCNSSLVASPAKGVSESKPTSAMIKSIDDSSLSSSSKSGSVLIPSCSDSNNETNSCSSSSSSSSNVSSNGSDNDSAQTGDESKSDSDDKIANEDDSKDSEAVSKPSPLKKGLVDYESDSAEEDESEEMSDAPLEKKARLA